MALIGAILGDICGSQYEFRRPHDLDWKNCELFTDKCKFTDDTVLSIATGMWLLDETNKEPWEFYLEYGKKYSGVGYGEMFEDWLYDDGNRVNESFGNGCAMRISPITMYFNGLADRPDVLSYYIDLAQWTCEKTHRHVKSYKGASIVTGCSFMALWGKSKEEIFNLMKNSNPAVIPRNHRVEEALAAAENGDFSVMNNLLKALANPFEHSDFQKEYSKPAPKSQCDYKTYCGT